MTVSAGVIKWFGGFNRAKAIENKFGFVEALTGNDVYLHQDEWIDQLIPVKGLVVYFELEKKKGKWSATRAKAVSEFPDFSELSLELLHVLSEECDTSLSPAVATKVRGVISSKLSKGLSGFNDSELVQCIALFGLANLSRLLSSEWEWERNVDFLTEKGVIVPLKDIAWNYLPRNYFDTHAGEVASHLRSLDNSDSGSLVKSMLDRFPSHLAMFCLLEGLIDDPADTSQLASSLDSYVKQIYSGDVQLPGYLKEYIATEMKSRGGIMADPSIGHIFSFYQFKKYLHEKDLKFVSLYEKSEYLQSRIDIFILKEIFSLLLANNSLDSVYNLFMGRLWEFFATKKIDLSNEIDKILTLFPACYSLPNDLSCEAIYWEKQEIFLCRGKLCSYPKVTGGKGSNYLEFSIYDWFFHYGIHYAAEKKPDRRDFPIKLAGYLNRLREIFDVLHCRQCKSLMLPDLRYGRVEYTEFTNGEFVKKDMAPAYRLTVFKCRNDHCKDHQVGYYINHCLGFGCYDLIDSRDCKRKCDNGLLICKGCGSCCETHAKSNPAGMCPDCGARLNLFESNQYDPQNGEFPRYVRCSNKGCGFRFKSLSKRFYLDSCQPVLREVSSTVSA